METSAGGATQPVAQQAIYHEVQRFRQWYFYIPIAVVTVLVWWQFVREVIVGRPVGEEAVPHWVVYLLTIIFGIGFPLFAYLVRMITEVRPGVLSVGLYPFRRRSIQLADIAEAMARQYSSLREFGGWGIRVSRHGKAYNAYGDQGVQLVMKDGARILVGTQRPQELLAALRMAGARTG